MSKFVIGQKWISENEPELGLGQVVGSDFKTVTLFFPLSGERRIYNSKTSPPLNRHILKIGEKAISIKGMSLFVEDIIEENGILHYRNKNKIISEDLLNFRQQNEELHSKFLQKLLEKNFSSNFDFDLRLHAAKLQTLWKSSIAKGMLGPRLEILPHQLYLCHRAINGISLPRLMLSDEVGLGKTIESGLIFNALQTEGRIKKTLIIVPEQLKNQWIIEFGKRFNNWFTNIDENYIAQHKRKFSEETTENVFSLHDRILCSMEFLLANRYAVQNAIEISWDLLIVDEAHRLIKTAEGENLEYSIVAQLSKKTPGFLLLSGTPIQLAPEAYFYRLKLLDSARFQKWEDFEKNQDSYKRIAKDLSGISLDLDAEISWDDLRKSIPKNSPIRSWLPIKADLSLSALEWIRRVIDALGTGSSVFRNTRKSVKGFPKRILETYPLKDKASELEKWLCDFVVKHKKNKILLICSKSETVSALLKLLNKKLGEGFAVAFKEEEDSLERDKAAAVWMQKDGPGILLSSEIGSEGRNFQNAQHLVLYDLPEDSSLLEQRIGRLDRIGQGSEIYIHVPFLEKSKTEMLFLWYHEALGIFEHSLMGGGEMYVKFENELRDYLENPKKFGKFKKEFLPKGKAEMQLINKKAEEGRDRLLEFNSQNKKLSEELLSEAKKMDSNTELFNFAFKMLESLDIDVQKGIYPNSFVFKGLPEQSEHATLLGADSPHHLEEGEISESDGCSVTVICNRSEALNYENIEFFHWEHPIMRRLFDKALSDDFGALAFVNCELVPEGEFWMQYNFILSFSVNLRWGISHLIGEHFLSLIIDSNGTLRRDLQKLENFELKNLKADIPPSVLEYFASEGFEKAKSFLEANAKNIAAETEKLAISTLENDLHRLEESYVLLRDFELGRIIDKKKKDILACKKSLENPKLRLNGLRIFAGM